MKKRVLSILLAAIMLIGIIPVSVMSAAAEAVITDMPKSNHNIKELVFYDKNPDPGASEFGAQDYPAVWALYDDPDGHENAEVFMLRQVASQEEAENQLFGIKGFCINGKWYRVIALWTVWPEHDIIDKGNGEKAVFTPLYCSEGEKPQEGDTVQIALYDYDANNGEGGISNLVEVKVPGPGGQTEVTVSSCTHENKESKAQVQNVKGNVTIDGKSTGVALVKEVEECTDCQNKKTTKVYRLRFKSRVQMYKYLSGKYAKLRNGKKVHFKGKFEKIEKVFWNKKHIKVSKTYNKKKGSVILEFTDEFLATVEDGIHELMVCNGDEFTAMSVTVQDHEMVEIGAFDIDDHAEISADQYEALMQDCIDEGIEVVDCDLDAFYAGGFMVNADDVEVEMNLSKDILIYTGDPLELPAVTLTSEMGIEYAEDEDYTLTYYQVVEGVNGEPTEVEIAKEDIKDIGTYNIVAMPTRNGVLFGEAWAQFEVIDEADCPHNWETLCDESGHWKHCTICGMSGRIQSHEDWTVKSEISHVIVPEGEDYEEAGLLCVTVFGECDDCGYRYPASLYNVFYSYDEEYYTLATLRRAELSEAGNAIYLDGDPYETTMIFVDGVMVPENCIDMIYGVITEEFLATIADGDHEVMVLNGDNFTVMTVTVTDHIMTAVKDKDLSDYEEMDFYDYYDTVIAYYTAGADIVNCELDELLRLLGDVDGDGEVTIVDATFIQRKLAGIELPFEFDEAVADVDGDGDADIDDVTFIQRYDVDFDVPYAIGEVFKRQAA